MAASQFSFTKIVVSDVDAAQRFYCDVLGLALVLRFQTGEGEFELDEAILSANGAYDGGHNLIVIRYINQPAPKPGEGIFGFTVEDVDATITAVFGAGGTLDRPPPLLAEHGVKGGFGEGPEGHLLEVVGMVAKAG